MRLNEKGQCPACRRKPLRYKSNGYWFCARCDRAYSLATGEQIPNFGRALRNGEWVDMSVDAMVARGELVTRPDGDGYVRVARGKDEEQNASENYPKPDPVG